ncbi:MAG: hypothetical protein IIC66_12920, partial [candidate division Zixibacteria bacterium]|nr:hypothetical protein [candidate division Zixibacteria bacterium]
MRTKTEKLHQARNLLEQRRFSEALAATESLRSSDPLEKAELYLIRCDAKLALGDFRIPEVELALNILGKSSNYQLFALAKFFKARIHINSGEYLEAQENLTEAYVYHKRIEDFRGMGRVSNLQSFIAFKQSDFASFRRYAEQSIKCYSRSDNCEQMG